MQANGDPPLKMCTRAYMFHDYINVPSYSYYIQLLHCGNVVQWPLQLDR